MPNYMVFRTPPLFNVKQYAKHSSEPIRYDCVTVVEADDEKDAVNALIAATGIVSLSFAAIECKLVSFTSESRLSKDGVLRAPNKPQLPQSNDDRLEELQKQIEEIQRLGNA